LEPLGTVSARANTIQKAEDLSFLTAHAIISVFPQGGQFHGNGDPIVSPKAYFAAGHANNARISGAEHLDASAASQAKFLKTMDVIRRPLDRRDPSGLSGSHIVEGNWAISHAGIAGMDRI
jgi:hypothetical protein